MIARVNIPVDAMRAALAETKGFIMPAAKRLGVGRLTLYRRMREAGLCGEARALREATGWECGTGRHWR